MVGDDQVLLGADGRCRRFPRRLRLYPDLSDTAPGAFARLPFRARTSLRVRGAVDRLSRGFIRPSLAVDAAVLGRPADGPLPVQRIVVVARRDDIDDVVSTPGDSESVVSEALQLLDAQRERLPSRAGGEERAILTSALADVPVEDLALPGAWPAGRAIAALAARLGVD